MSDNDNEKLTTLDDLRDELLASMTPEEALEARRHSADFEARLMTAAWVLRMRKLRNLSHADLAQRLGKSEEWVRRLERRETEETPTVALIMLIANVCGLYFLGDIKTEPKTKVVLTPGFVGEFRVLTGLPKE